jgi:hypothetical protein
MNRSHRLEQQARFSLGVSALSLPRVWVRVEMKHGKHHNEVAFHREEHPVRKIATECPPSAFIDVHQTGYPAVVGLMDSTLSRYQADLLTTHVDCVVLMLDGDEAGPTGRDEHRPSARPADVSVRDLARGRPPTRSTAIKRNTGHHEGSGT